MGLLPSPRTQNYLPQYREERYEPNLVSLRSAKNDQVAAMNSMLQQQGANPATMAARQASLYGEAAKNIAGITEQENNTNAQILNQAKAQNAQIGNQFNQMQEAANKQYVTENAQDLAALDNDRYKKLSDLYSAQQKVNQYNKTLQFLDDNMAKNMNVGLDSAGNVTILRNENAANFNSNDAAANLRAMQQTISPQQPSAPQQNTQQQTTTPGGRYGRKNLK
jgi:phage gp36-like protein